MTVDLHCGDSLEVLRTFPDNTFDTVISDPPSGIFFMGKNWDSDKGGRVQWINWLTEIMAECLRVTKPGGSALVWSIPRTSHWTGTALEMAGWEVRDVVSHIFSTGFPKSTSISKQLDKRGGQAVGWFGPWFREWRRERGISSNEVAKLFPSKTGGDTGCVRNWELGFNMPTPDQFNLICQTFGLPFDSLEEAEREVVGSQTGSNRPGFSGDRYGDVANRDFNITAPATEAARMWDGWGSALKPACEFWWLCQKPLDGTYAENALRWNVAGLAIDRARIPANEPVAAHHGTNGAAGHTLGNRREYVLGASGSVFQNAGRWPANLILQCLCDTTDGTHDNPECPCAILDAQSGTTRSHDPGKAIGTKHNDIVGGSTFQSRGALNFHNDSGGSSRFFAQVKPDASRMIYAAKSSRRERNAGLEGMPEREQPDAHNLSSNACARCGLRVKANGSGVKCECGDLRETIKLPAAQNHHPTVKSINLCRYLARLTSTPTGGTVLDPFMGSGSIGCAAVLEGRDFVGIDIDPEYVEIARARIAYWQQQAETQAQAAQPMLLAAD